MTPLMNGSTPTRGLTAIALLALLALPGVAGGQQPPPPKAPTTLWEAVEACVMTVRREAVGAGMTSSQAEASVKSEDQVSFFGSPKEHVSFKKCLIDKGHRIGAGPGAK